MPCGRSHDHYGEILSDVIFDTVLVIKVCTITCAITCVLQDLQEELGSFARQTTLQATSENLVSVIQEAYNVRVDVYHAQKSFSCT